MQIIIFKYRDLKIAVTVKELQSFLYTRPVFFKGSKVIGQNTVILKKNYELLCQAFTKEDKD